MAYSAPRALSGRWAWKYNSFQMRLAPNKAGGQLRPLELVLCISPLYDGAAHVLGKGNIQIIEIVTSRIISPILVLRIILWWFPRLVIARLAIQHSHISPDNLSGVLVFALLVLPFACSY